MRRAVGFVVALLALGGLVVQSSSAHPSGKDVLDFDVMAGVVEPFTGSAHPVRGVSGGGLPWELDRASGELRSDGRLKLRVRGLVLARRAPVAESLRGRNPIPQFRAVVSCLTPASPERHTSSQCTPTPR